MRHHALLIAVLALRTAHGADCVGKAVAVTLSGQPSVGIAFIDVQIAGNLPISIAAVRNAETGALSTSVDLVCESDAFQLKFTGEINQVLALDDFEVLDGANYTGLYSQMDVMVDIMYAYAPLSKDDKISGKLHIYVNGNAQYDFLKTKFDWVEGADTASLVGKVLHMKKSTGACPMLHSHYNRLDDLGGSRLLSEVQKRHDFLAHDIIQNQGGVPDSASEDWRRLANLLTMQERDDEIHMRRHFFNEASLKFDQMQCLADRFAVERSQDAGAFKSFEGNTWEYVANVTTSDYNFNHAHLGFGQLTGMIPRDQVSFSVTQGPGEHLAFKRLLNKMLPPNNGFGSTADGLTPPELGQKWKDMEFKDGPIQHQKAAVNLTHVPEMVFGLAVHWISGYSTASITDLFAKWLHNCASNTFFNRDKSMTKNEEIGMRGNCLEFRPLLDGLAAHFVGSPVWDIVRDENIRTNKKYEEVWTPQHLVNVLFAQISFLSDNIVSATRYLLEDADARSKFRADPEKAILEYYRLSAPVFSSYALHERKVANVSYTERKLVDSVYTATNKTGSIYVGTGQLERLNLYSANRDPRKFTAPNTFKPDREDWLHALTFGAPLSVWYDVDPQTGAATFNSTKPLDDPSVTARFYCPGFYALKEISKVVVTAVLDSQERVYAANRATCTDDEWEIGRVFGYAIYPEYSICRNAMARMDARYEKGVACEIWGDFCCQTCKDVLTSNEHTKVSRLMMMRALWYPDQFTFTDTSTYRYFLATQRYWDEKSIVEVTPTGKKNYYKGPESILEYYSLQNEYFNPPSYRVSVSIYNLTQRYYPKWDKMLDDNKRMHSWNFEPAVTLGTEPTGYVDPAYDFSQFVWHDETSIYPLSRAFHDFRKVNGEWYRKGLPTQMADAYGDVEQLCHLIQERCVDGYKQFEDFKACYKYMSRKPKYKLGYCPLLAGDTLACRYTHVILSHEKMRPEAHCYHMGPHIPDPDGKLKCHDAECGHEKAGPLVCDELTCDGSMIHAGQFVDWMNFSYWAILFVLAVMYTYVIDGQRNTLAKGIAHLPTSIKSKAEDLLLSMNRAYPLVSGASMVFLFEALMFGLCAGLRDDIQWLWRPWPVQAGFPRFSDLMSRSSERKTHYQNAPSDISESSEPFFSSMNQYMVDHTIFYVLLSATLLFIITLEWLGTYLHAPGDNGEAESNSRFAKCVRHLADLGHTTFVVFVAVSLYFPSSAFSFLLFCLGITKLMYPEITIHMWTAFETQPTNTTVDPASPVTSARTTEMPRHDSTSPKIVRDRASDAEDLHAQAALALRAGLSRQLTGRSVRSADRATGEKVTQAEVESMLLARQALASKISFSPSRRSERLAMSLRNVHAHFAPTEEESSTHLEAKAMVDGINHKAHGAKMGFRARRTVEGFCSYWAGVGLMLHHTSMAQIFCASSLGLHVELSHPLALEKGIQALTTRRLGLGLILMFVLLQHLVSQVVPFPLLRLALLLLTEIFFQWFTIANMWEVATTIDTIGSFGIIVSHYLMALAMIHDFCVSLYEAHNNKVLAMMIKDAEGKMGKAASNAEATVKTVSTGVSTLRARISISRKPPHCGVRAIDEDTAQDSSV